MPLRDVRHLAQLDFAGPDAAAFLQGYATADLGELDATRALPMAFCNLKGRVIANGWIVGEATEVHLLVHPGVAATLQRELGKYLLFAKSKFNEPTTRLRLSPEATPGAIELPPSGFYATLDVTLDAGDDEGHPAFADACADAGFVVVTESIAERFLPQMIGLTDAGAVSFSKGCYLGQEVVARAEHRGQVKQRLRRYRFDGEPPPVGADVMDQAKKIGTIVAAGSRAALAATRSDATPVVAAGRPLVFLTSGNVAT